jgi:hypothetical protein
MSPVGIWRNWGSRYDSAWFQGLGVYPPQRERPVRFILGGYDATGGVVLQSSEIGKPAPLAGPLPPSHPSAGRTSLRPTAS